jgi:hypothetical protein
MLSSLAVSRLKLPESSFQAFANPGSGIWSPMGQNVSSFARDQRAMFDRHLTDLSVSEFLQAVASAA